MKNKSYKNTSLSLSLSRDKYSKILKESSVVILAAAFLVSGFFVATPNALATDMPPTFISIEHSPASPIVGQLVLIHAYASDDYLLANTKIYLDDVNVLTCDFSGKGFFSADCPFETTTLSVGLHTYYAITTDSAGHTTRGPLEGTKSFTVAAAPNNPPILDSIGNKTVNELESLTFTVTATDVENDTLTYSLVGTVPAGASIDSSTGVFTWTPIEAQGPGSYTFDVVVSDGNSTDSETITITVNEVNVAPTANDQLDIPVTTDEDVAKVITLTATDTDLPDNTLTYSLVSGPDPAKGIALLSGNQVTYTPVLNYNGLDSFTFIVNDGTINSNIATVNIIIRAVNDAPSFIKGADQTVLEDAGVQTVSGWATAISAGPADESGQMLDFIVSNNNNALFSAQPAIAVDGTLTYTPAADANGSAIITVSIHDDGGTANGGQDTSATQIFTINVTAVNDAPVLTSVSITPADPKTNDILTANVTANDVDGDALTYMYQWKKGGINITGANSNTLNLSVAGNGNKNEVITVTAKAVDWDTLSSPLTSDPVTILNSAPIAIAPTVPVFDEDTSSGVITLSGSDADGDSLTYTVTIQPAHGTLTGTAPNLTYNPNLNFNGADSFTFQANDGTLNSDPVAVSLSINPVNDAPVLTSVSITPADPKTNDVLTANPVATDVDGDILTYTYQWKKNGVNISEATSATLNLSTTGNGAKGDAITVEVVAHDATLPSAALTSDAITILNSAPVADAQTVSAFAEDTTQAITLTGSDADSDSLTYSVFSGPTHGVLTGTAPNLTYTPNENYNGVDSFTFKVYDGTAYSDPATVSLTVTAVNDTPTATIQSVTTNEDTAKLITLVGSDIDDDLLIYIVVGSPTHGVLTGTAPNLTYTPDENYNGPDSFTFKVSDGTVDSNIATVDITITAVNDAPVLASIGNKTVNELESLTFTVTATDVENDTLTYSLVGTVPAGASIDSSTGVFTWTPIEAQGPGSYTFDVVVSDGNGGSDSETIIVAVTGANLILTAPSTATITKSASLIAATNGKADSNAAVETAIIDLTPVVVTLQNTGNAASANVRISPIGDTSGHIQFWAKDSVNNWYDINITGWGSAEGFSVPVSITNSTDIYIISDIAGAYPVTINLVLVSDSSIITTVTGTVTVNNAVPVLTPIGPKLIDELSVLTFTAVSTDVDGDIPSYSLTGAPTGAVIDSSTGVFTWTPIEAQGPGSYTFDVVVSDGNGGSDSETITITVNEVNVASIASGQLVTINEDTATTITLTATDTDLPANTPTYTILTGPSNGNLSGTAPNLTYTPNENYNDVDSFTFKVYDGTVDSNIATVDITITAVNDAPVATDDVATTDEDTPLTISQSSLLTNDTDADGPSLSVSAVGNTVNGSVVISGSDVIFTPDTNFNGTASFEYTVSDGNLIDVGLVTITVNAVNDVPVAVTQSATTAEDVTKDIILSGSDADGDSLTYLIITEPVHGLLSGSGSSRTYTPATNYNGADSFTFKVNDKTVDSAPATVSLTITPVNDAPEITLSSPLGGENWSGTKVIAWTATDIDGDTLTITIKKSIDGTNWTNIAIGEANNGTYLWDTASVSDGMTYLIKVIALDGTTSAEDTSDAVFTVDNTVPTIVSYLPSDNAVGVDPNTNITVAFSEDVVIDADNVTISGEVGKTVIFDPITKTATIDPASSLANNTTYTITLTGITDTAGNPLAETTWSFTTSGSYNVQLTQGWNLISIPVVPNNTAIGTVLGSAASNIDAVWAYDAVNDAWYVYRSASPSTSNLASMTAGYGYWVNYTGGTSATLAGPGNLFLEGNNLPPQRTLKAGWNLIGYYQKQNTDSVEAYYALWTLRNPDSGISWWTMLMGYNNDSKQFTSLDEGSYMDPGKGYWILIGGRATDTYIYAPGQS